MGVPTAAKRMAVMRERRARGEVVITLLLGPNVTTSLVERGLLGLDETTDANAVTVAICRHLRASLIHGAMQ